MGAGCASPPFKRWRRQTAPGACPHCGGGAVLAAERQGGGCQLGLLALEGRGAQTGLHQLGDHAVHCCGQGVCGCQGGHGCSDQRGEGDAGARGACMGPLAALSAAVGHRRMCWLSAAPANLTTPRLYIPAPTGPLAAPMFGLNSSKFGMGPPAKPLDPTAEISRLLNQHTSHWMQLDERWDCRRHRRRSHRHRGHHRRRRHRSSACSDYIPINTLLSLCSQRIRREGDQGREGQGGGGTGGARCCAGGQGAGTRRAGGGRVWPGGRGGRCRAQRRGAGGQPGAGAGVAAAAQTWVLPDAPARLLPPGTHSVASACLPFPPAPQAANDKLGEEVEALKREVAGITQLADEARWVLGGWAAGHVGAAAGVQHGGGQASAAPAALPQTGVQRGGVPARVVAQASAGCWTQRGAVVQGGGLSTHLRARARRRSSLPSHCRRCRCRAGRCRRRTRTASLHRLASVPHEDAGKCLITAFWWFYSACHASDAWRRGHEEWGQATAEEREGRGMRWRPQEFSERKKHVKCLGKETGRPPDVCYSRETSERRFAGGDVVNGGGGKQLQQGGVVGVGEAVGAGQQESCSPYAARPSLPSQHSVELYTAPAPRQPSPGRGSRPRTAPPSRPRTC